MAKEKNVTNGNPDDSIHLMRPKGEPRTMPPDFSISLATKGGTERLLVNPGKERRQSMRGFEETYVDIIDYIVRITHRIWEEKDVGYIYDTYKHNSRVQDGTGLQYGRDKIVADTIHTINAFPDIRLYADDIVWAGDDEVGFHTSHRTVIKGNNSGFSRFGPPTSRQIEVWCIANCIALENEIFEEWVLYDTAHLIRQLGFNLVEKAREAGNLRAEWEHQDPTFGEPERLPGQGKPPLLTYQSGGSLDVADFLHTTNHNLWNRRMVGGLRESHALNVQVLGANGRRFYGRNDYQSFLLSILAMFPDLAFQIDDLYWMGNDQEGFLTAMRWSITGTHRGWGIYGPPTKRPIHMWGITQHRIHQSVIVEEWMLFNEFELMQQIFCD